MIFFDYWKFWTFINIDLSAAINLRSKIIEFIFRFKDKRAHDKAPDDE